MEIVSAVKDKAIDPVIDIVTGTPDALKDTFTTKEGAFAVGTIVAGSVVGGLTAAVSVSYTHLTLPTN